jgi:ribosomal protein S18 acetylase RimI-like enzyme
LRDLRSRLGLDAGYLSRLVRALEKEGLIRVGADAADGRIRVAELTAAGRAELAEQHRRANDVAEGLLGSLTEQQRAELTASLGTAERLLRLASIVVEVADPVSSDARGCLAAYAAEIRDRFPEGFEDADLVDAAEVSGRRGAFVVAYEDGRPVGCGAVRTLEPRVGEIRHVWVAREARSLGLGRRLLAELERRAAELGHDVVRLGTHESPAEAIAMYRSCGYVEIPQYDGSAHTHHWFEKRLTL